MGRSTSCFKIITCGGDSADQDDLSAPPLPVVENKGSSDKRGWSFRKRSARHRVLSNTVSSETPPSANKEIPESTNLNYQPQETSPASEKVSVIQNTVDKNPFSTTEELKVSEAVVLTKDESESDLPLEESVVIGIQAAVRVFLAQRELLKLKNVVKVQAVVRGHLVRQHAVGSLRCVQAIVKMQALVRARQARFLLERSDKDNVALSKTLEKENTTTKPNVSYISIEKLLSNKFARQLMEATPKNMPINIKCDSSKPNSAWNWLERWMAVSSAEPTPQPVLEDEKLEGERIENIAAVENKVGSECLDVATAITHNSEEIVVQSESSDELTKDYAENFKFEACRPTLTSVGDYLEQPLSEKIIASGAQTTTIINSGDSKSVQSDVNSQTGITSFPAYPEIEGEQPDQPKRSMKRLASEQLESEGKKVHASRKASNPSFIAAHSNFEEVASTTNSNKSCSSLSHDVEAESKMNTFSSGLDTLARTKEFYVSEDSGAYNLSRQYGGSECGTEISVTSALDSPDIFEGGAVEYEHEAKVSEEEVCNPKSTEDKDVKAKDASNAPDTSIHPVSNFSNSVTDELDIVDVARGEAETSTIVADFPPIELKPERSVSDIQREVNYEGGEASPRSHITISEPRGTPSSEVSVKGKVKSGSSQKRKSLSTSKRSPSTQNHDSGVRSSLEQLPKDQKNGKRRNSFGSTKSENIDQEPRDSSSSNSLPHFMQATESAKAKLNANNSPRSSPDVLDRDFVKKRYSLPGANGRQGSPRIQRSTSQAQSGAKVTGSQVVQEKKWLK